MKHVYALLLMLIIFLPITACSSNQDETIKEKDSETSQEQSEEEPEESNELNDVNKTEQEISDLPDTPTLPTNFEESAEYPIVGNFAGEMYQKELKDNKEIVEVLDKIPPVSIDDSEEKIEKTKQYIYSLFKENLKKPNVPLNQWNSMQFGGPQSENEEIQLKERYNVAILLDSSGSMGFMEGDQTRMALAKQAINKFVEELPETANVSLSVYGHIGTGDESDKEKSCTNVEEMYQLDHYDANKFENALSQFEPAGWTPMAKAIEQAEKDFGKLDGEENTNIFYIVSDGVETCDGDPVEAIQSLDQSNIDPVVNIIGYQVDNEGLEQLKEMAKVSEGRYIDAKNQGDLSAEFEQTVDMSKLWSEWQSESKDIIRELHSTIKHQLHDWHNDEKEKTYRQQENLKYAVKYLHEEEILDRKIYLELSDLYRNNYLTISDDQKEIYADLYDINQETYTEKFDEVEAKFEKAQD